MDAGTPRFSYFSTLFTVHLFRQWIPSLERLTFASATCNPQPRIHGLQIIGLFPSRGAAFGARGIGEPAQTQDVRNTKENRSNALPTLTVSLGPFLAA